MVSCMLFLKKLNVVKNSLVDEPGRDRSCESQGAMAAVPSGQKGPGARRPLQQDLARCVLSADNAPVPPWVAHTKPVQERVVAT